MIPRPLVLLVPSLAAASELPRRLASTGRAIAGVRALKPVDLARWLVEPSLLVRGLRPWTAGHDALLAARLLAESGGAGLRLPPDAPRMPVAAALARTLTALRYGGVSSDRFSALAASGGRTAEDEARLLAVARVYRDYDQTLSGRVADPAEVLAAARRAVADSPLLDGADVLVVDDLELDSIELDFISALAEVRPVRILRREFPAALRAGSLRGRLPALGEVGWSDTWLGPIGPGEPPASLRRLRESLFDPPAGDPVDDGAVELLTAAAEGAEVRAVVRRLLREAARGVPFEEMGVVLPRPETYAPLFTDLLTRLGVPHRLHPSLPLRFGRAARSLLLLFRCRGLERQAVMEFLTYAPIPFEAMLGADKQPHPSRWDEISREARIVSGLSRWIVGLRSWAEAERDAAAAEREDERRDRRLRDASDAEALLHVVEILGATLDGLAGEASWPEWVDRLRTACDQWIGPERDREALLELVAELADLGSIASHAAWDDVEAVLETRMDWERLPLEPLAGGAVHLGALDAMAGLTFRVLAIPGLVEGGYPGVFRPDPFLLDGERMALAGPSPAAASSDERTTASGAAKRGGRRRSTANQLELFSELVPEGTAAPLAGESAGRSPDGPGGGTLPTSQDRLVEARRVFHRALSQAGERLILSYPRADARTGRERLPSLFFVAAASTLLGRPLAGAEIERLVVEDGLDAVALEQAVDRGERDRIRLLRDEGAAGAIAAGSPFFRQSRLASEARWSGRLTRYDGLVGDLGDPGVDLRASLDPLTAPRPVSASRLATYARCGFLYLLQNVLRLQPAPPPEERRRIEPLERGEIFHAVAERFLRERRDAGELPVRDTKAARDRLRAMAEQALEDLVASSPPRFQLLWKREKRRFHDSMQDWLRREAAAAARSTPAHFEVSFGLEVPAGAREPHDPEPLMIDLGEGRQLRLCGKIDRIDRRADGLVLRDYKTGRAPRDDGGVFRGGRQLQIPFYVLAAAKLFPDQPVVDAFLDYVDGGRQVAFRPELARSAAFQALLGRMVSLIARGVFVQEPSACDFCDFTSVCGPKGLLQRRQAYKIRDASLQEYLRLRDVG